MSKRKSRPRRESAPSPPEREPKKRPPRALVYIVIAALVAVSGMATYLVMRHGRVTVERQAVGPASAAVSKPLGDYKVVNAHEHLFSRNHLDKYLAAAEKTGVVRTVFLASSEYTLMGAGREATRGNEENTREILEAAKTYPDKIIPFCTIHPGDPDKLDKIKGYVADGARGLKLYTGHANFHDRPLDAEEMMPVYAYCDETRLPICWHVNLVKYQTEFERVMRRFPKLVVIVPHFGVTFFRPSEKPFRDFQRLMDTYPNVYTDTSFGTRGILVQGLEAVSRDPEPLRRFFAKYGDRVFFGTDMVVTGNKEKTPEWIEAVIRACRDMLEKDRYTFDMGAKGSPYADPEADNTSGSFRGLALDEATLHKLYETNIATLFPPR